MITAYLQREEVQNPLLRRADWRFLLPNPRPTKTICFASGSLTAAAEYISEQVADAQDVPRGDCDLAVAINPDHATLRAAQAALCPGGACYTEWYTPFAKGAEGVRRRLEAAGFSDVRCYWAWPPPSHAPSTFWLPLEASGVLRYFLATRLPSRGLRRIGRAILRIVWLLSHRLGVTLPICAVARKPIDPASEAASDGNLERSAAWGTGTTSDADPDLFDMIRRGWRDWGLGPTPNDLSVLLLTGGPRSISKAVALIFADQDSQPILAIKMPRVPESLPGLAREAATLKAVQALRPGGVRGAPRVVFVRQSSNFLALGETVLTGLPLYTMLRRGDYRDLALQATAWLEDLIGQPEARPPDVWWGRLIEPMLADFTESFGPVLDWSMLRETRDILTTLGPLPLVCEQRDFSPWNVVRTADGELVVLDWESAELQGLPAQDLIYFLTYLAFFLDGAMRSSRFRESYRAVLDPSTFTGKVARQCLERYAHNIDMDVGVLHPLRLLLWLRCSRSEYEHLSADAGGRPEPALLRRSLFLSLWEEELRHGARV